jgi:hypothetical protein
MPKTSRAIFLAVALAWIAALGYSTLAARALYADGGSMLLTQTTIRSAPTPRSSRRRRSSWAARRAWKT